MPFSKYKDFEILNIKNLSIQQNGDWSKILISDAMLND